MVLPLGTLTLNPEFEKAKSDLKNLRDNYISLVEKYNHLINVVGKNLVHRRFVTELSRKS